jgi:hypothetical protein
VFLQGSEAGADGELHLVGLLDILEHDHAVLDKQAVDLLADRRILEQFAG